MCETFKYGLCSPVVWLIWAISEIAFSGCETDIFIAILEEGRFADDQEFRFQSANLSNTVIAVLQEGRLATSQKSRFQAAKRSNVSSTILQDVRFAEVH